MLYTIIYRNNANGDECQDKKGFDTLNDAADFAAERLQENETAYIYNKDNELVKTVNRW